jgi:hypothetical protein
VDVPCRQTIIRRNRVELFLTVTLTPKKSVHRLFFLVVAISNNSQGGDKLARSNYQFNKRQKELARKKKKEEKRQLKLNKNTLKSEDIENQSQDEEETL